MAAFAQAAATAEQTPQLPGGASALSETHGDWTVNCQIANGAKLCSLSHQQFNKANGQRLLAMELVADAPDSARGTMALPFGLALARGVGLQVDEKPLQGPLHFDTCQAVGCLVQVTFDAAAAGLLKSGATLRIDAVAADTGQPIGFNISLTGFNSALKRTAALSTD
jgi:invasion protein IalB